MPLQSLDTRAWVGKTESLDKTNDKETVATPQAGGEAGMAFLNFQSTGRKEARSLSHIPLHGPSFVLCPHLAQTLRFTGHMAGSDTNCADRSKKSEPSGSVPWAGPTRRHDTGRNSRNLDPTNTVRTVLLNAFTATVRNTQEGEEALSEGQSPVSSSQAEEQSSHASGGSSRAWVCVRCPRCPRCPR